MPSPLGDMAWCTCTPSSASVGVSVGFVTLIVPDSYRDVGVHSA